MSEEGLELVGTRMVAARLGDENDSLRRQLNEVRRERDQYRDLAIRLAELLVDEARRADELA